MKVQTLDCAWLEWNKFSLRLVLMPAVDSPTPTPIVGASLLVTWINVAWVAHGKLFADCPTLHVHKNGICSLKACDLPSVSLLHITCTHLKYPRNGNKMLIRIYLSPYKFVLGRKSVECHLFSLDLSRKEYLPLPG